MFSAFPLMMSLDAADILLDIISLEDPTVMVECTVMDTSLLQQI